MSKDKSNFKLALGCVRVQDGIIIESNSTWKVGMKVLFVEQFASKDEDTYIVPDLAITGYKEL